MTLSIMAGNFSITKSISSSVVNLLKLQRILPWIAVNGTFIALNTWLGSSEPDVQAEPAFVYFDTDLKTGTAKPIWISAR